MDELKKCPFCGGKAFINIEYGYWCECYECGACTDKYKTQAKAVEAWNKRHYEALEENGYFILPKSKERLANFSTVVEQDEAGKITLYERIDIIQEALDRWRKELDQEMAQKLFETFRPTCEMEKGFGSMTTPVYICGKCGAFSGGYTDASYYYAPNHCPNCGAKVVR